MTPTGKAKVKRPLSHKQAAIIRVMGERLREAREMCGMSQVVAARRLGLPNGSKLSKLENAVDVRTVPEWLLHDAAKLYQVSLDYLYGTISDWETGARMTQERETGAYLLDTWEVMRRRDMEVLARLHDQNEALCSIVKLTFEENSRVADGLRRFAEINPQFELMRGSAMLAGPIERAMEAAMQGVRCVARFKQQCQLAAKATHQLSLQLI